MQFSYTDMLSWFSTSVIWFRVAVACNLLEGKDTVILCQITAQFS